jgi:serine/threonine protein kinase/tetratricopeptide (TPR) repeat protein
MPFPGKQALDLVDSVLELPAEERSSYLDQTGCDASVRHFVEGLVLSYERSSGLLDQPALIAHAHLLDPSRLEPWLGRHIGAYRLLEELGEGGMGTVYRAARADDQYRKEVALKILKSAFGSSSAAGRFKTERQILANLEHPNVARLLDGGNTEEGLPFFVMELVAGRPIDEYCDAHHLPLRERLSLFAIVCGAVQYAHQNQVIHRDLKPGNVLVTGEGVPKLLDFGIAKILDTVTFPAQVDLTRQTMRMLTPEYASPEQVRGELVSASSDVYSLGVMLYLLLTGHRPYQIRNLSPQGIAQVICDTQPPLPSISVRSSETVAAFDGGHTTITPAAVSSTRDAKALKLSRMLAGDLDTIVLKALCKEPQRRYASVAEFAADIQRHLDGAPVLARRDSIAYRAGKFVRRNAVPLCATLFMLAVVAASLGWVAWHKPGSLGFPNAAIAPMRARPAVAVLGFKNLSNRPQTAWLSTALAEMLNTELAAGEKLRAIPGASVAQMKADLALDDEAGYSADQLQRIHKNLGADLVLAGSYLALGDESGGAIRLDFRLENAVSGETLTTSSLTATESRLPDLAAHLGAAIRAALGIPEMTAAEAGAVQAATPANSAASRLYAEGVRRLREFDAVAASDFLQRSIAAEPANGRAYAALAAAWLALGYDDKAVAAAQQAFALSSKLAREDQLNVEALYRQTLHDWKKAAEIYKALFRFFPDNLDYGLRLAEAQVGAGLGNDALQGIEALRGLPAPARDDPRIDLAEATAARTLGDYRRASTAAAEAIRKGEAAGMRSVVARASIQQAVAQGYTGNVNNALASARAAEAVYRSTGDRGGVAAALNTRANTYYQAGDLSEAKKTFREALEIYRAIGNKRGTAGALDNIANVIGDEGDLAGAQRLSAEALAVFREIGDERGAGNTLNNIATDLVLQGDLRSATSTLQSALAIRRKLGDQEGTAVSLDNLGAALLNQGALGEARSSFEEALKIRRAGGRTAALGYPLEGLGEVLAASGDLKAAKQDLEQALNVARETGEKHLSAVASNALAEVLLQQDQVPDAMKMAQSALEIRNSLGEKGNAKESSVSVAEIDLAEGGFAAAANLAETALEEFQSENLRDDEILAHAVLASALLGMGKPAEAEGELDRARANASSSQNRFARLKIAITEGRVRAALGKLIEARRLLADALAESKKYGLLGYEFEARLAAAGIDSQSSIADSRARLKALSDDAAAKDFRLVARKASLAATN